MLGENLEEHYMDLSDCVNQINALLNTGKLIEEEITAFMQIGYQYYSFERTVFGSDDFERDEWEMRLGVAFGQAFRYKSSLRCGLSTAIPNVLGSQPNNFKWAT